MHQQSSRQLQERLTSMPVDEVLDAATRFFARGGGIYTAFLEKRGPSHVAMRGQGGEEVVIGARAVERGTFVSGGSYLFDQQIAAFLDSLPDVAMSVLVVDSGAARELSDGTSGGTGSAA